MRLFPALALCCTTALSAHAQSPEPSPASGRVQFGLILGIAKTGLSVSYDEPGEGFCCGSGNGTSPYIGLFARRTLTPSVHVGLQGVFDLKGDDGARYSIPYVQFPLQVEYTPFAPRDKARWVRPVLIAGGSAGVRLNAHGGTGYYSAMRPFEFSALAGLGVEAHFRSRDWVQLGIVAHRGLTDLQPEPGKTSSFSVAAYIKAHPGAMRRHDR
ncbi:MAG: hypothetical protein Q8K55_01565 [Gemmatimonadaceae bacterium]|nr:hypothetical protein [Gemmatimonadaceae bacterium]